MSRDANESPTPGVELPITPMLDMTFQLLAFFILTFQPAAVEEGQLGFSLPTAGESRGRDNPDIHPDMPPDTALDQKAQVTVVLKADHSTNAGAVSAILIQTAQGETPLPSLQELRRYLKDKRDSQDLDGNDDIRIRAESKLKYAYVIEAMDICVQAGFRHVGLAPPSDLRSD